MKKCENLVQTNAEKCEKTEQMDEKSVWSLVAGLAVDYIEAQENSVTKEEVAQALIETGKVASVSIDKVKELVEIMLAIFAKYGILTNNSGVYTKRTIKDVYQGKNIQVEYRSNVNENIKKKKHW